MTPKEEAKELVDKFYQTTPNETWIDEPLGEFMKTYTAWGQAKQCALIAVDEILKQLSPLDLSPLGTYTNPKIEYWLDVKNEIEKL